MNDLKKGVVVAAVVTLCLASPGLAQQSESGSGGETRGTYSRSGKGFLDPCRNPERSDDAVDFRGNRCPPRGIGDDLRGRYDPNQDLSDTTMKRPGEPDESVGGTEERGTTNHGMTGGSASPAGSGTLGSR